MALSCLKSNITQIQKYKKIDHTIIRHEYENKWYLNQISHHIIISAYKVRNGTYVKFMTHIEEQHLLHKELVKS